MMACLRIRRCAWAAPPLAVMLAAILVIWPTNPVHADDQPTTTNLSAQNSSSTMTAIIDALFDQADDLFARGIVIAPDDAARARDLFHQAGVIYAGIADRGVVNPQLLVNAGNAFMLADETGQAVLHYRRAQRLAPTNRTVQQALDNARARVGMVVRPDTRARIASAALSWRGVIPRALLLGLFLAGYLGLWTLATMRVTLGPGRVGGRSAVIAAAVCIGALTLVWIDQRQMTRNDGAVVIAPAGVIARNGPSAGVYEATFTQPLEQGVEVRVLESRDGWTRVRLIDGHETWLPQEALEQI